MTESPAPEQSEPLHRNNFDFLRLLFASLVILSHSPELVDGNRSRELLSRVFHTFSFGEIGVAGFFVLSGYLIAQSRERSAGAMEFLRKRVLRIYPGFIVASLFSAFVFGPLGADAGAYFGEFDFAAFVGGVVKLTTPAIPPTRIGNGSLWTIQIEFVCYLMVLAFGLPGWKWWKFCSPVMLLCIAAMFLKKGVLFAPFSLFGFFFAGSTFFHFRNCVRFSRPGFVASVLVLIPAMFHPVSAWLALCTAGAYLLFHFAFHPIPVLQGIARNGDISYGTYLYAWPVQCLLIVLWPGISPWVVFVVSLPVSMACGWLSWHAVEKHFLRLKKRKPKPAAIATEQKGVA